MRWPWVSREAYDAVTRERNYLAGRLDAHELQQTGLVNHILTMRREGFAPKPEETAPVNSPAAKLPRVIEQALDKIGLYGTQRMQMETWAWRQLDKGGVDVDPAQVAADLLQGGLKEEAE